ncbi:hypothetical protein Y1Q_0010117 [Alligator mississippiensis]|uniref:Uncharacterized protein n=1 Tax=Alligator mississippiensis TaxID=8496 RepID=A0A151MGA8_ALLMI|nr:hypothetical protein Y1Q_0010117 [Alligator mississippiensis]
MKRRGLPGFFSALVILAKSEDKSAYEPFWSIRGKPSEDKIQAEVSMIWSWKISSLSSRLPKGLVIHHTGKRHRS